MARTCFPSSVAVVSFTSIMIIIWLLFSPSPRSTPRCKDGDSGCELERQQSLKQPVSRPVQPHADACDCRESIQDALSDAKKKWKRTVEPCTTPAPVSLKCPKDKNISVHLFEDTNVVGIQRGEHVYLPFNDAITKRLELSGKVTGKNEFTVNQSDVQLPKLNARIPQHSPAGPYMNLHLSDIGRRSRVMCIGGRDSVPISKQWSKVGHFYPIQICQYGMSHFGKHITSTTSREMNLIHGGTTKENDKWEWEKGNRCSITTKNPDNNMLAFHCDSADAVVSVSMETEHIILMAHLSLDPDVHSGVTANVLARNGQLYHFHYANTNDVISVGKGKMVIGVSDKPGFFNLLRDLDNDFKVFASKQQPPVKSRFAQLMGIEFFGTGQLGNLSTSNVADRERSLAAADWLMSNQDTSGGWPVSVTHIITPGVVSKSGSHSAMAQGQAISLLCRIYTMTKDKKYLLAAEKALRPFHVLVADGGVVSHIWGNQTRWYEEYATEPSLHVLNGFIFSLLGLYDLSLMESSYSSEAQQLFEVGFQSLTLALPLFDNGHGTFYDLRHVVVPGKEPNRARWQYHSIHIQQLLLLNTIRPTPLLVDIAQRWLGYAKGIRSRHN